MEITSSKAIRGQIDDQLSYLYSSSTEDRYTEILEKCFTKILVRGVADQIGTQIDMNLKGEMVAISLPSDLFEGDLCPETSDEISLLSTEMTRKITSLQHYVIKKAATRRKVAE